MKFTPDKDIPDLSGRVVLVTGGKDDIARRQGSCSSDMKTMLIRTDREHRARSRNRTTSGKAQSGAHLLGRENEIQG